MGKPPDLITIVEKLEDAYPNIRLYNLPPSKFPAEKLGKLVTYIQYGVPRFLYEKEIDQLEKELMEYYLQCQLSLQIEEELNPLNQQN